MDRWYRLSDAYPRIYPFNPASVAAPLSWSRGKGGGWGTLPENTGFEVMQWSAAKKKNLARVNGLEGFFPDRTNDTSKGICIKSWV